MHDLASDPRGSSTHRRRDVRRRAVALAQDWLLGPQGHLLLNGPLYRLPESLRLTSETRLLDLGFGQGTLMRVLDEQVRFDHAPVGLAVPAPWSRLGERSGGAPTVARGSESALPFARDSFTLVTCGYVVGRKTTEELSRLFAEVKRVLTPGGLALLWDFGPTGNRRLDRWNRVVLQGAGLGHVRLRSSLTLLAFAEAAGFEFAREANLRPFLFPPIPRASILIGIPPEQPPEFPH